MKKLIILIVFCTFSITSCSKTNCGELKFNNGITKLNGELFNGTCNSFYFTGEIKSEQKYLNGLDHGKWFSIIEMGPFKLKEDLIKGNELGLGTTTLKMVSHGKYINTTRPVTRQANGQNTIKTVKLFLIFEIIY